MTNTPKWQTKQHNGATNTSTRQYSSTKDVCLPAVIQPVLLGLKAHQSHSLQRLCDLKNIYLKKMNLQIATWNHQPPQAERS